MNELQIECFLSVARHLSFSEAAKERYITQPSISKQIKKLEEDIGVPLFERTGRRPELTPWGERFYDLFADFEKRFKELQTCALDSLSYRDRKIKIAFLQASNFFEDLSPVFNQIINSYHRFQIEVFFFSFGEITQALLAGKVDILFCLNPPISRLSTF